MCIAHPPATLLSFCIHTSTTTIERVRDSVIFIPILHTAHKMFGLLMPFDCCYCCFCLKPNASRSLPYMRKATLMCHVVFVVAVELCSMCAADVMFTLSQCDCVHEESKKKPFSCSHLYCKVSIEWKNNHTHTNGYSKIEMHTTNVDWFETQFP